MLDIKVMVYAVERIDDQKYVDENQLPYDGFVAKEMQEVMNLLKSTGCKPLFFMS